MTTAPAAALMVPTWDAELKAIKDEASHEAFCSLMPELRDRVDPELVEPVTGVLPIGALRTTWRAYEQRRPSGLVAVADAFCHTDPSFALGLSFSLVHAFTLADLVRSEGLAAAPDAFWEQAAPEARERFELARDVSATRLGRLRGDKPQPSQRARLFATLVACAPHDPEAFRVAFRLTGFLDTLASVEAKDELLARLEPLYEQVRTEQPTPSVTRDALVQALRVAA